MEKATKRLVWVNMVTRSNWWETTSQLSSRSPKHGWTWVAPPVEVGQRSPPPDAISANISYLVNHIFSTLEASLGLCAFLKTLHNGPRAFNTFSLGVCCASGNVLIPWPPWPLPHEGVGGVKKIMSKIFFPKWSEMARKLAKSLVLLLYLIFDSLQCCKVLFFLAVSPPKDQHTPSVAVIETLYSHWHLMGTDTQLSINKHLQTKWKDAAPVLRSFFALASRVYAFDLNCVVTAIPLFIFIYVFL